MRDLFERARARDMKPAKLDDLDELELAVLEVSARPANADPSDLCAWKLGETFSELLGTGASSLATAR